MAQQPGGDGFPDLCDLKRVGEAGAVEIVFAGPEDLGLILEPPEGGRVQHAVAVDLERGAVIADIGFPGYPLGVEGSVEMVAHG